LEKTKAIGRFVRKAQVIQAQKTPHLTRDLANPVCELSGNDQTLELEQLVTSLHTQEGRDRVVE